MAGYPWSAGGRLTAADLNAAVESRGIPIARFGALCDGVADDTNAMALAVAYCAANPGTTLILPPGRISLRSAVATGFSIPAQTSIKGAGRHQTVITWNDDAGGGTRTLFAGPTSGRVSDITLEGFTVRGQWATLGNAEAYPIVMRNCDGLLIRDVCSEYSRVMGVVARYCADVVVDGCLVRYCGRDGINTSTCTRVTVCNNVIEHCDDDGIASHTAAGAPEGTPHLLLITGNRLFDCQGINAIGARHAVISGNVLDCVKSKGIAVACATVNGTNVEGVAAGVAVVIAGNQISNVIDRVYIDGLSSNAAYIYVSGYSARAGSEASIPGIPTAGTGAVPSYYDYLASNSASVSTPTPPTQGIVVSGNVLMRTLKGGVPFSSYGRGKIFVRSGWQDPTIPASGLGYTGVWIDLTAAVRNVLIHGNHISGMESSALAVNGTGRGNDIVFADNLLWDIKTYGVLANWIGYAKVYIRNNHINMDPLHRHSGRNGGGTWTSATGPTAIQVQSGSWLEVRGNVFRNVWRDSGIDTSLSSAVATFSDNVLECDPNSTGAYDAANKGVGVCRNEGGVRVRHVDSDPSSATYGQVLTADALTANVMPTSGKFVRGRFIKTTVPTIASGKALIGWLRVTTGAAHVSGTDWAPVYGTTS